jgi:hypothetical protein
MRLAFLLMVSILLCPRVATPDEDALRRALEGRVVAPRLDMPATTGGVNVYPHRRRPLDHGEVARDIARYGVGVPRGRAVRVTRIKVKGKHVEFQLGAGGERQEPSTPSVYVPRSREERRLEEEIRKTRDREIRDELEDRLHDLRDRRRREKERLESLARIEHELVLSQRPAEEWALMAGARFNVRFDSDVPPEAVSPQGLMGLMERWLDFEVSPDAEEGLATVAFGRLRKGMPEAEVELDFGPPLQCEDSPAAGLEIRTCRWSMPEGHLEARFVEGVLVKYTVSSEPP